MSTQKLSNISLTDYRKFLEAAGLNKIRTAGGHETWSSQQTARPITLQTHVSPVPEFIIKQHLRHLNLTREEFFEIFEKIEKALHRARLFLF